MQRAITVARGGWDEEREVRQFRDQLELGDTRIIELAATPIGFYTLRMSDSEAELHTICVDSAHQNQGIGTFIVRGLLASNASRNIALALSVLKSNHRATALYKRLGMQPVGETEHHIRFSSRGRPQSASAA